MLLLHRSVAAVLLTGSIALASPEVPPSDTAAPIGSAVPAPQASPEVTPPPNQVNAAGPELAPQPVDSMLEVSPPPVHVLGSWQEAVRLLRARSTALHTAAAQSLAAAAESERSLTAFYPTLQATGSIQHALLRGTGLDSTGGVRENLPDPATQLAAGVSLRQPILNFGAWHDHHTATLSERAAEEREADLERLELGAVASTVVSVVTAERLAEVSRVALRSSLSTLELTRRRAELGASSRVDVLRAQQEVALNRVQVVSANENLVRARESLGMALGYVEAWGVAVEIKIDALAADAAAICKALPEVTARADVRAAKIDSEVAVRRIERTHLQLAPRIDLSSDFNYTTREVTDNGKPMQWTIGALLTIPLYDGGVRTAARHLASAQAEVAAQQVIQVTRKATLESLQAERGVRVAADNLQGSIVSRDLAKEAVRLAELSFVNGKGTNFELVDAQRRYQQSELELAVKEFEVVRARITALLAQVKCTY